MAKNIGEEGKRDFEMSFSLFSPQLALNYLGRTLYKVSRARHNHVEYFLCIVLWFSTASEFISNNIIIKEWYFSCHDAKP